MNAQDHIAHAIADHIAAASALASANAEALTRAAARCVRCLIDEHRLFVCSSGNSSAPARQFSISLLGRMERERPGLPVFCLPGDTSIAAALSESHGNADLYARQLRALGQEGDVLLVLSEDGANAGMVQAAVAAHERSMDIIAVTGGDGDDISRELAGTDIEIRTGARSSARANEIHLLVVNIVCDLIERELFGDAP